MSKALIALNNSYSFQSNVFKVGNDLLSQEENNLYVGMVIKDFSFTGNSVSKLIEEPSDPGVESSSQIFSAEDKKKAEIISMFEKNAKEVNINYEIHTDFNIDIQGLLNQSIYSDLLILNYQIFYNPVTKAPDPTLLYKILNGCKCPVLILPSDCDRIDNIIMTYDNKESSVYAIKSFSNLFASSVRDKIVSVLTVMPSADEEIKNEELLLKLVKHNYSNVGMQLLEGQDISEEITKFAESLSNPLIVMGAYGRSRISNIILPSVAQNILKKSSIPMFISHH